MSIELAPSQIIELADLIANRLADESRPLDYGGLSKWLGISIPKIEQMKRTNQIPFIQAGRRVLFDRQAVLRSLTMEPKP